MDTNLAPQAKTTMDNPQEVKITNESLIRLNSLMVLFNVSSISGRQESWGCEGLQVDIEAAVTIPEDTLAIIESTATQLIKHAYYKHIGDGGEVESNGDWWDFSVDTSTSGGIIVTVSYSINGETESEHEIDISQNEIFNEQIKPLLEELKVSKIEMVYSGGGDSGGTDHFEMFDLNNKMVHEDGSKIQNWFEEYVWDHVGANFNDSGSQGNASLDCLSDTPTIICTHADFFDDEKSFEEVFTIEDE